MIASLQLRHGGMSCTSIPLKRLESALEFPAENVVVREVAKILLKRM